MVAAVVVSEAIAAMTDFMRTMDGTIVAVEAGEEAEEIAAIATGEAEDEIGTGAIDDAETMNIITMIVAN
jgi:hypothetical protein